MSASSSASPYKPPSSPLSEVSLTSAMPAFPPLLHHHLQPCPISYHHRQHQHQQQLQLQSQQQQHLFSCPDASSSLSIPKPSFPSNKLPPSTFFNSLSGSLANAPKPRNEANSSSSSSSDSGSPDIENPTNTSKETNWSELDLLHARLSQQQLSSSIASRGSLSSSLLPASVKQTTTPSLGLGAYGLSGFNSLGLKGSAIGITAPILGSIVSSSTGEPGMSIPSNLTTTNSVFTDGILISSQHHQPNNSNQSTSFGSSSSSTSPGSHFTQENTSPTSSTSSLVSAPVTVVIDGQKGSNSAMVDQNINSESSSSVSSFTNRHNSASSLTSPSWRSSNLRHLSSAASDLDRDLVNLSLSGRSSQQSQSTQPNISNSSGILDSSSSSNSRRNSMFFPDPRNSSNICNDSPPIALTSLTSPSSSISSPSSSGNMPPVHRQPAPKPHNNLVSLLDRFSNIGDVTRSAELTANEVSSYDQPSASSSRHSSFSVFGVSAPFQSEVYGVSSSSAFSSPFVSPGPSASRLASSPWQQTTSSSTGSISTVVSPSLSSTETAQYQPISSQNGAFENAFSSMAGIGSRSGSLSGSLNGSPLPPTSEPANISSARSPIFQSTYSSVFSSPASSNNDGWQSPFYQNQAAVDDEFSYKSPSLNPPSLDYQRSSFVRSSPANARFSPQASNSTAEKTLRQQLAYHQQAQQQKLQQEQFFQQQTRKNSIDSSGHQPLLSSSFKFNPHASYVNNYNQQYDHPSFAPSGNQPLPDTPSGFAHAPSAANGNASSNNSTRPPARFNSSSSHNHGNYHNGGKKSFDHSASSLRSPLLEEFRSNKTKKYELRDIYDHVVEFSGDQYGSRFIQSRLETASSEEKERVFDELRSDALQLMTDVFGNYVIQKFFELGNQMQKTILAKMMDGQVLSLSFQMYGCRVIQKAIEHILTEQQARLISELDGHVLQCIKDQNGNHVIQKAIERIPAQHIQFILKSFDNQVLDLATHAYGCRVIQRMLEYCDEPAQNELLKELHRYSYQLIDDQYGNYVMQHVIERGKPEDRDKLINLVCSSLVTFSRHKFASNVVEKCIVCGSFDQRRQFIDKILEPKIILSDSANSALKLTPADAASTPLCLMMKDQYANYVIQKLLEKAEHSQRDRLIKNIKAQLNTIKKVTVSKHVASIERILELDTTEATKNKPLDVTVEKLERNINTGESTVSSGSSNTNKYAATPLFRPAGLPSGPASSSPKAK